VPNGQPIPVASVETANITIGESPYAIAVNPNASRIYVADGSSLTVIDASSHSVMTKISLPAGSNGGIAIDYNTNMVYVSVEGEVAEINGSTNMVVGELPLNSPLGALAYDPHTRVLYGSEGPNPGPLGHNGSLVGVDVRTGSVVANISLGYRPHNVALNPKTNMIYAVGCDLVGLACGAVASVVNGTSGTLVSSVNLNSAYYTTMTANLATNLVYASGASELVALNGTNGDVVFHSNPQTCGPFLEMGVIPSSNQVLMVPQNYDYLLVYDGTSGALVNMYSFPSFLQSVAYNPNTDELYVALSGQLLAFHDSAVIGNVNATLIGSGQTCLPV